MNRFRRNPLIEFFSESRLVWIVLGVVVAFVSAIPYFILGENSIVTYHDQLDGELLTYILNAKHLFDGSNFYPEIMNGISKNGMVSPAPLFIVLFKFFKPFTAFVMMMIIIRLCSVVSMFLLLDELTEKKLLSFLLSVLFMLLPFYTVYGLCIPGQPILYYSLLRFRKEKWEWPLYFGIVFYVMTSSFALVGYAIILVTGIWFVVAWIKGIHPFRYLIACVVLAGGYVAENISLVLQALGITQGFVSHKTEVLHSGQNFLVALKDTLVFGATYTEAYQMYYIPVILIALIAGAFFILLTAGDKEELEKAYNKLMLGTVGLLIGAVLTAFFDSRLWAQISNSGNGLFHDFNFSRFSWLMTVAWIIVFALSVNMLWLMAEYEAYPVLYKIICSFVFAASLGLTLFFALYNNDLKPNLMKLYNNGDYYQLTWKQFFAEDLFEKVDELIGEEEKSSYRVVSLGIYPAAASYNGYYCLDAYSNNYDVNYKHEFGEIIRPQLDQSEYLTDWYDNWGNRCYIVLNESMNYFTFEKKWGTYSTDWELDFDKLREMGCKYIISASYLIEPEQYGITLLNEDEIPIETLNSWYRLFVYEL